MAEGEDDDSRGGVESRYHLLGPNYSVVGYGNADGSVIERLDFMHLGLRVIPDALPVVGELSSGATGLRQAKIRVSGSGIRSRLNWRNYRLTVEPNTLGANAGNVRVHYVGRSAGTAGDFTPRPGKPTGRDWAQYFRYKYGRENVEWSSLKKLRSQWSQNKGEIISACEAAYGRPWPCTPEGRPYVPHHSPALSEGGTIWDIEPMHPNPHGKLHGGGKTVKPPDPFNR